MLKGVSREFKQFLEERNYVALLFQGAIWKYICINILQVPGEVWGEDLGKAITGSFSGVSLIPYANSVATNI